MEGSIEEEEGSENESVLELVQIYERFVRVIRLCNFPFLTSHTFLNSPPFFMTQDPST